MLAEGTRSRKSRCQGSLQTASRGPTLRSSTRLSTTSAHLGATSDFYPQVSGLPVVERQGSRICARNSPALCPRSVSGGRAFLHALQACPRFSRVCSSSLCFPPSHARAVVPRVSTWFVLSVEGRWGMSGWGCPQWQPRTSSTGPCARLLGESQEGGYASGDTRFIFLCVPLKKAFPSCKMIEVFSCVFCQDFSCLCFHF